MADWDGLQQRARERYEDGEARLPDDPDARQKQLTRMGNAAGAAGLDGADDGSRRRRVVRPRRRALPARAGSTRRPGSWGRPIGAIKARILAGDWEAAASDARWALEAGAAEAESPIGRYAAALAFAVLGEWDDVRVHADYARTHEAFPQPEVADALAYIAAEDVLGYVEAVEDVLESFETRDEYLEDIPVADTVLVLQALAGRRDMATELESPLLP